MTVELSFSFLVPFLIYLIQKKKSWFIALILISIPLNNYLNSYIVHFMFGILLAKIFCIKTERKNLSFAIMSVFLVIAFIVYSFQQIIQAFPTIAHNIEIFLSFFGVKMSSFYTWTAAIGSAYFIYYIITYERVKKVLMFRPLVFIGKISYSIYLVHWLVIYYILNNFIFWLNDKRTLFIYLFLNTLVIILTIPLSALLYYTIELPFIQKGKKVAVVTNELIKKWKIKTSANNGS